VNGTNPEQESNSSTLNNIPATPQSQGKRKHADERQVSDPGPIAKVRKTYTKHPVHWALDGNLLLQLGSTRFRVYRGRLTSESTWFQSLIERSAGILDDGFEDQDEIDMVVQGKDIVDGMDVFDIEFSDGPTDKAFATLLTAMSTGM